MREKLKKRKGRYQEMIKTKSNNVKLEYIVFGIYLSFLVWLVLFKFATSFDSIIQNRGINLIPFSASEDTGIRIVVKEMIYNVFAFIPFGLYISIICSNWPFWKKVLLSFGLSLTFEVIQYIFALGISDITDLINNTAGAVLGIGLFSLLCVLFRRKTVTVINVLMLTFEVCFGGLFLVLTLANL